MAGGGAVALAIPQLIDHMMKNPTFGDMMHRWANSSAAERSLANWPRLAAYVKNNGVTNYNDVLDGASSAVGLK